MQGRHDTAQRFWMRTPSLGVWLVVWLLAYFLPCGIASLAHAALSSQAERTLEGLIGRSGKIEKFDMLGIVTPAVSATTYGRIYFSSADNRFEVSENAGAFVRLMASGGNAPADATYITQSVHAGLSAEQSLGALTTGLLLNTVTAGTGVLSIFACAGTTSILQGGSPVSCTVTPTIGTSLTVPTLYGGAAANDDITIEGTSHGTKTTSYVILQPTGGNVGIGTPTPSKALDIVGGMSVNDTAAGGLAGFNAAITFPNTANAAIYSALGGGSQIAFHSDGKIRFYTAGTLTSFLDTTGGFSLGTTGTTFLTGFGNTNSYFNNGGNLGLNTSTFGTNAASVFGLGTATAPTTSPADMVQLWAADWAGVAGGHALSVRTEGGQVHGLTNLGIIAALPTAETIAAAATITADACGGFKRISSAGAVTTNTTDTFTTPAAANAGCVMAVCNTGANTITLDANAKFKTTGGLDVVLTADDCVIVASTGASGVWYQISSLNAN